MFSTSSYFNTTRSTMLIYTHLNTSSYFNTTRSTILIYTHLDASSYFNTSRSTILIYNPHLKSIHVFYRLIYTYTYRLISFVQPAVITMCSLSFSLSPPPPPSHSHVPNPRSPRHDISAELCKLAFPDAHVEISNEGY